MKSIHSDEYPEQASVLQRFVAGVQNALGSNFLGAYLVGWLATGDFDLDSDVDFLILTNVELSDAEVRSLQTTHVDIHALGCYPAEHLEGSYISTELLNRTDLVGIEPLWFVDKRKHVVGAFDSRQSMARSVDSSRRGITIIGPDPKTLLHRVPTGALRSEAVAGIQELKSRFVTEIDRPLGWFNTRFGQSFALLTCCRMLYTCKSGTAQSKPSGVKWAEQSLDPAWGELIRKAWTERMVVRFGDKVRQPAQTRLLHETARFIAYAQSLAENWGPVPGQLW